eukprot:284819462_2
MEMPKILCISASCAAPLRLRNGSRVWNLNSIGIYSRLMIDIVAVSLREACQSMRTQVSSQNWSLLLQRNARGLQIAPGFSDGRFPGTSLRCCAAGAKAEAAEHTKSTSGMLAWSPWLGWRERCFILRSLTHPLQVPQSPVSDSPDIPPRYLGRHLHPSASHQQVRSPNPRHRTVGTNPWVTGECHSCRKCQLFFVSLTYTHIHLLQYPRGWEYGHLLLPVFDRMAGTLARHTKQQTCRSF